MTTTFGPIPSRRLGRSLGINNIPPKVCTYSCVYCQVGRTSEMQVERCRFYDPDEIVRDVRDKVEKARAAGEAIDYLTFVPDGEPTLDLHLGREIRALKSLGIPIGVISNASLLWREDVRADLSNADWVSLKVDAVCERAWRSVDRPRGSLSLATVLEGALAFARTYRGTLVSETMLVAGINGDEGAVREVAAYLACLCPATAYLSVPTRPPAELWVRPPGEATLNRAYQMLSESGLSVEVLIGYEGNDFASTGNVREDLLSIAAVHPLRADAVSELLDRAGREWSVVHELVAQGTLVETAYGGHTFYVRRLCKAHDADRP